MTATAPTRRTITATSFAKAENQKDAKFQATDGRGSTRLTTTCCHELPCILKQALSVASQTPPGLMSAASLYFHFSQDAPVTYAVSTKLDSALPRNVVEIELYASIRGYSRRF